MMVSAVYYIGKWPHLLVEPGLLVAAVLVDHGLVLAADLLQHAVHVLLRRRVHLHVDVVGHLGAQGSDFLWRGNGTERKGLNTLGLVVMKGVANDDDG